MNAVVLLALLSACSFAQVLAIDSSEENQVDQSKCSGIEEVDLSEFNLSLDDLRKLAQKAATEPNLDLFEDDLYNELRTTATEYGLGSERKVVIFPNKTRSYTKTYKASDSRAEMSTTFSGSLNSSLKASTSGKVGFNVELSIYGQGQMPTGTVSGDSDFQSDSASKWIKKYKVNILETQTNSSSDSTLKMNFKTTEQADPVEIDLNITSSASSTAGTLFMSKTCFGTKSALSYNTKMAGTGWSADVTGSGKAGIYSHVLWSNNNGSSATWTFARLVMKSNVVVGQTKVDQYIVIKSFSETVTAPARAAAADALTLDVTTETKVRVEVKSRVTGGWKVYSSGGTVSQRKATVVIPSSVMGGDESEGADSERPLHTENTEEMALAHLIRSQVQADDIVSNGYQAYVDLGN